MFILLSKVVSLVQYFYLFLSKKKKKNKKKEKERRNSSIRIKVFTMDYLLKRRKKELER